jgi:hypothetical protein
MEGKSSSKARARDVRVRGGANSPDTGAQKCRGHRVQPAPTALTKVEFIKHQSAVSRRCDAARSKMREKRKLHKPAEKIESQH